MTDGSDDLPADVKWVDVFRVNAPQTIPAAIADAIRALGVVRTRTGPHDRIGTEETGFYFDTEDHAQQARRLLLENDLSGSKPAADVVPTCSGDFGRIVVPGHEARVVKVVKAECLYRGMTAAAAQKAGSRAKRIRVEQARGPVRDRQVLPFEWPEGGDAAAASSTGRRAERVAIVLEEPVQHLLDRYVPA
jgi:hypothetical protein